MMATQETPPPLRPSDASDRARWLVLRRAAHLGHLQPEGFQLVDEIHERHPEWREEWDQ